GSECAEWHSGPQLLARGDGACWYWAAKLYSPRVRRSGPSISGGSGTGCKTSPALRRRDCRPNTVSTRCHSSSSAIADKRTTSHFSRANTWPKVTFTQADVGT